MADKKITFGQVRQIPEDAGESRIIPFVLSTPQRDRHHSVLNQNNWKLDNYRLNPVVGYMHNLYGGGMCTAPDPDDVIGHDQNAGMEDINGKLCLCGNTLFDPADINIKAEKVFRKLLFGSLRAVSVGFEMLGVGKWGTGDEAMDRSNETYYFEGQELLEYSVVNIPSNAGAGKRNMQSFRDQTFAALAYVSRELGKDFRLSQIQEMRVCDVLDLLDGRDIDIKEKDPEVVRKKLMDEGAKRALDSLIDEQMKRFVKEK